MKTVLEQDTLGIYSAENYCKVTMENMPPKEYYHVFPVLMKEPAKDADLDHSNVLMHTHFTSDLYATTRSHFTNESFHLPLSSLNLRRHFSGAAHEALARWLHGMKFDVELNDYGSETLRSLKSDRNHPRANCRTGTLSTFTAMGIRMRGEFLRVANSPADIGVCIDLGRDFKAFDQKDYDNLSLEELQNQINHLERHVFDNSL